MKTLLLTLVYIFSLLSIPLFSSETVFFKEKETDEQNRSVQFSQQEREYLQAKKVITMCIDPNWMPFEGFDAKGNYVGMTSHYFEIFQKDIGIPVKVLKTKTWAESLEAAKARKCDIISLAMMTPERKKYMNVTSPYLSIPLVLATRIDAPFIDDFRLIKRHKIGIVKGYAYNELIRKKYPNIEIIDVKDFNEGLQKVADGELYGFIGTLATIGYTVQKNFATELKISGKFSEKWELGIAVRNDEPLLLSIFEKEIQKLSPDQKQAILNKYISGQYIEKKNFILMLKILAVLALAGLLGVYHYRKLAKMHKELQSLKDALQIQIDRDSMTDLYNRRYFYTVANDMINLSHREKKSLSVIMIDIDFFKKINDTYGHAVGDIVIKKFAEIMIEHTRKSDIVARMGGEEFVILLPNTDLEGARKISLILREAVEKEVIKINDTISVSFTISIGVTVVAQNELEIDDALNRADKALYHAKKSGRNRVEVLYKTNGLTQPIMN